MMGIPISILIRQPPNLHRSSQAQTYHLISKMSYNESTNHFRSDYDKGNRDQTQIVDTEIPNFDSKKTKPIQNFFPFELDILGEVVEIGTTPTEYGAKNSTKRTTHTIAQLQNSMYFNKKYPPKATDKTYRWIHLPGNDMHWFEVLTPEVNN
jgi:hypothetical protein